MKSPCFALGICFLGSFAGAKTVRAPVPTVPYSWRNVEIVAGGFVTGITFHPKQNGLVYARTDIGGAYRWEANTGRWIPLNDWVGVDNGNLLGIESLAVDPNDPKRLYLAVGTYSNDWGGNGAILRSNDQGRTFVQTDLPFKLGGNEPGRSIGERLAVDPKNGRIVYFGTRHNGLWRSTNAGATWKKVDSLPDPPDKPNQMGVVGVGFVVFDGKGGIYVGVGNEGGTALYRSRNNGATWTPLSGQPTGLTAHHAVFDAGGTLFVTGGNGTGPNDVTSGAVWKWEPASGTWTDVTPEKANFGYAGLTVDPKRPGVVIVSTLDRWSKGDTLFRTTDGGKTWYDLKAKSVRDASLSPYLSWGRDHVDLGHWIGDVEIDPHDSGHVLYVTGATIWGTRDATNADRNRPTHWTVAARGLEETAVLDLVSPPTGDAHLLSGLGDIGGFRHTDLSVSPRDGMFANPRLSNTDSLDFAENAPNVMARVGRGGGPNSGGYSTDGGATWQVFPSEPSGTRGGGGGGTIAVSADGKTILWSPRGGASPSFTRDNGISWTACAGLERGAAVIADRQDASRFYAYAQGTLYSSTDNGATFTGRQSGPSNKNGKLRAVPGRVGDLWLAAGRDGLWHATTDGTLTRVPGVSDASVLGTGKAAPGRTYPALYLVGRVGTQPGVFRSDDTGTTWLRINDDRHQWGWIGQTITGDPRIYGRVYIGTNGRGIQTGDPK